MIERWFLIKYTYIRHTAPLRIRAPCYNMASLRLQNAEIQLSYRLDTEPEHTDSPLCLAFILVRQIVTAVQPH